MCKEAHSNDYYGTEYYKTCKNMGEHAKGENQGLWCCNDFVENPARSRGVVVAQAMGMG
jgi:hypothetical protein